MPLTYYLIKEKTAYGLRVVLSAKTRSEARKLMKDYQNKFPGTFCFIVERKIWENE